MIKAAARHSVRKQIVLRKSTPILYKHDVDLDVDGDFLYCQWYLVPTGATLMHTMFPEILHDEVKQGWSTLAEQAADIFACTWTWITSPHLKLILKIKNSSWVRTNTRRAQPAQTILQLTGKCHRHRAEEATSPLPPASDAKKTAQKREKVRSSKTLFPSLNPRLPQVRGNAKAACRVLRLWSARSLTERLSYLLEASEFKTVSK